MPNIVPRCETINCYLDGKWLSGDIEVFDPPEIDPATENVRVRGGIIYTIDVELRGRDIQSAARQPKAELEIRAALTNYYGEKVWAIWKCRGLLTRQQDTLTLATTLKVEADFYEHTINGEEKIHIDIMKFICQIDGDDLLAGIRETLGIPDTPDP